MTFYFSRKRNKFSARQFVMYIYMYTVASGLALLARLNTKTATFSSLCPKHIQTESHSIFEKSISCPGGRKCGGILCSTLLHIPAVGEPFPLPYLFACFSGTSKFLKMYGQ